MLFKVLLSTMTCLLDCDLRRFSILQVLKGKKSSKDASVKVEDIVRQAESTAEDASQKQGKLAAAVLIASDEQTTELKESVVQPSHEVSKASASCDISQVNLDGIRATV